jgi:pseudouridine synthase|tara:strand:+ start:943 stop:1638 length:696 start_codon:yes stop_codon:yes gene_type:complete
MRLNKFLSHAGVASRRKCDEYIESGKVQVNGKRVTDFSYQVQPDDIVLCDRKLIENTKERVVYLLNKPKGYICTNSDTHDRKKVVDLLPPGQRLFTIGRLDRDTTGAILVTNDGDLANQLMHPRFKKEKIYLAETKEDIDDKELPALTKGMQLDRGEYAKGGIKRLDRYKGRILWEVILTEGKNREVKRIFEVFGTHVISLHRHSFAGLNVNNLKVGKYRQLNSKIIQSLF